MRQRPILLIGPPGVGKTAIMEQIAAECGVGLVSYTMTHHTRQSAIGLPRIEKVSYGGTEMDVTRYTLSEIIASVYDCMERTGKQEGILFLDEINCVSETLAPTMLQFLQNKTFGTHRLPAGWMIVAAGNPRTYNKSVREFDVVTLDRVRRIEVEADLDAWMTYAQAHGVHSAVISYLSIRNAHFYLMQQDGETCRFVTARGWEDLSEILKQYERLHIPIRAALVSQYLQHAEIARSFAAYYQLYCKYGEDYAIPEMLQSGVFEEQTALAKQGSFEERFTVVHLVLDCLAAQFARYAAADGNVTALHQTLQTLRGYDGALPDFIAARRHALEVRCGAELMNEEAAAREEWILQWLEDGHLAVRKAHVQDRAAAFELLRSRFAEETADRRAIAETTGKLLTNAFRFLEAAFGDGQEMVLFLSALSASGAAMDYIGRHGSDGFLAHGHLLCCRQREKVLQQACLEG